MRVYAGIFVNTFSSFSPESSVRAQFSSIIVWLTLLAWVANEAAGCEGRITKGENCEALKKVGKDKTSAIDGLPYEVYLRLSIMFVNLLEFLFDHGGQRTIPWRFTSLCTIKSMERTDW